MTNSDDEEVRSAAGYTPVERKIRKPRETGIKTTPRNGVSGQAPSLRPVCEILVSNIPDGTSEELVSDVFSEYEAIDVKSLNKGKSAYVTFASWKQIELVQEKAVAGTWRPFNGQSMDSMPLGISLSLDAQHSLEIYVGDIKHSATAEADLEHHFRESINVDYFEQQAAGRLSYAFVAFGKLADAEAALKHLHSNHLTMSGTELIIGLAHEYKENSRRNPRNRRVSFPVQMERYFVLNPDSFAPKKYFP